MLIMHTDTMVLHNDWLRFLLGVLNRETQCGIVGSWKIEIAAPLEAFSASGLKKRGAIGAAGPKIESLRPQPLRLYRKEAIQRHPPMFDPSDDRSAGEELHFAIEQHGFRCRFLPPHELCRYVQHLNHATMALNNHFGRTDRYMPPPRQSDPPHREFLQGNPSPRNTRQPLAR